MPLTALIGCQWGDEGKGKIVDVLAENFDLVVRFQGGNNAGHTVVVEGRTTILHTIPTGILHPGVKCLVGNGVVINPFSLRDEMEELKHLGLKVEENLLLSENAHLILPYHLRFEELLERLRGKASIGTTMRGIGCAYADKALRLGIRIAELRHTDLLKHRLQMALQFYNPLFQQHGLPQVDLDQLLQQLQDVATLLSPLSVDGVAYVHQALTQNQRILAEGAQGVHLDIDFGTYPFVTSSNPSPGSICTGLGISPGSIHKIIGVTKAYTTRVGAGPMPTELTGEAGDSLREAGAEYGATTRRPRRCGWLDLCVLRRSLMLTGAREFCLTKLDVLSGIDPLKICTAYRSGSRTLELLPLDSQQWDQLEPVYEELPGWHEPLQQARSLEDLPTSTRNYIKRIEDLLKVRMIMVSVGAERAALIMQNAQALLH